MFGRSAFQGNHFVEQPIELAELGLAELLLHPGVVRFDGVREALDELQSLRRRLDCRATLVVGIALAADQAVALHAREHAGEAGPEDEGFARDTAGFHRAVLAEHAQHAPLLVRQAMAAQAGPRVRHHGLARLQQQAGQVAVLERGGGHGAAN